MLSVVLLLFICHVISPVATNQPVLSVFPCSDPNGRESDGLRNSQPPFLNKRLGVHVRPLATDILAAFGSDPWPPLAQRLLNATSFNILQKAGFPLEEDSGRAEIVGKVPITRVRIIMVNKVSICRALTMCQTLNI